MRQHVLVNKPSRFGFQILPMPWNEERSGRVVRNPRDLQGSHRHTKHWLIKLPEMANHVLSCNVIDLMPSPLSNADCGIIIIPISTSVSAPVALSSHSELWIIINPPFC
jgi:hypothetical protein